MATHEAARNLENQLTAALAEIQERLNSIEAHLSNDHRNDALAAIKAELEELSRRYQAAIYLWSDGMEYIGPVLF